MINVEHMSPSGGNTWQATYREIGSEDMEVRPHVYQDGDSVTMQFRIGEIQSEMLVSDPTFLVLSYT